MSTKKPEKKEPVYCIRCRMLVNETFCIHGEVTAKDPIEPGKAQWAREVNENNDCPHFEAIPKPKVYCEKCVSFKRSSQQVNRFTTRWEQGCYATQNLKDTYMTPQAKLDRKPSEINANNDCPWFREKPKEPERTVGDVLKTAEEMNRAISQFGAVMLSEIAPKRPWWKFWQRKEA